MAIGPGERSVVITTENVTIEACSPAGTYFRWQQDVEDAYNFFYEGLQGILAIRPDLEMHGSPIGDSGGG